MKNYLLLAMLVFTLLSSCTLQKRKYMDGYYTHHSSKNKEDHKRKQEEPLVRNLENTTTNFIATASNTTDLILPESTPILISTQIPDTAICDIIQLKNKQEISCIVTEISPTEIRYKRCDNLSGPTIVIPKSDVFLITYKNGTIELIDNKVTTTPPTSLNNQTNTTPAANQPTTNTEKKVHPLVKNATIFAIAGYVFMLFSFVNPIVFVLAYILMLLTIIFSCIGMVRIRREPKKYIGKKRAILLLLLGIIGMILGPVFSILFSYLLFA